MEKGVELIQGCPNVLAGGPYHLTDTVLGTGKMIYILNLNKCIYKSVLKTDLEDCKACLWTG